MALPIGEAHAANVTWKSTATGNWGTGSNWSSGSVPANGDNVFFNTGSVNCSINADPNFVNDVTITSGYTGTISQSSSRFLPVTGNFTMSGGGTLSAINKITIDGNFSQTGGTFNAPTTMIVNGGFSKSSGGTFTAGSGTIVLSAGANTSYDLTNVTLNNVVFTDGLIGYWKFDETSIGTATDSSGFGATLTHQSSPTSSSSVPSTLFANARSVLFAKATPNYANVTPFPTQLMPTGAWTISTWIKVTSIDTSGAEIVSGGNDYSLRIVDVSSSKYIRVIMNYNGTNWTTCDSSNTLALNDGVWHHVVGVNDGTNLIAYLDGVKSACSDYTGGQTYNHSDEFDVGRHPASGSYDFDGNIDELRIYNRALSDTEINNLYLGSQPGTSTYTQTISSALTANGSVVIGSGTLTSSNAMSVGGSWFNYGGRYTGTGTVTFTGTTTGYTILGNRQPFSAITLNGASGGWTVADPVYVTGALTLTNGTIDSSSYPIRAGTISKAAGGTFTASTGSLILTSSSDQTATVSSTLNNLRVEDATETSLVGYWKLDEMTGLTAKDSSVSGNNGTLTNDVLWSTSAPTTTFDNQGSASFDGTNDYITLGTTGIPVTNASQSVSLWVYYTALPGAAKTFYEVLDSSTYGYRVGISSANAIHVWRAQSSGSSAMVSASITNTTTYPLSTWRHVVYTFDGTTNTLYIDGTSVSTSTTAPNANTPNTVRIGARSAGSEYFAGRIDDVRVYTTPLSSAQVKALYAGGYPGTGGTSTFTLGANTTVNKTLAIDSGTLATSSYTLSAAASDATKVAYVYSGGLTVGSAATTYAGGLYIEPRGTLTMSSTGGQVNLGSGKTLQMNGTMVTTTGTSTTKPTIQASSGSYDFSIGTTATSTPTLNIDGLAVKNTTTNGMYINSNTSSVTTFTKFDNIDFSNGNGNYMLRINVAALTLYANGVSFDNTGVTYNAYVTDTTSNGSDTRLYFGGTCAPTADCEANDLDDDTKLVDGSTSGSDGYPDDAGNDGAVIQWLYRSRTDTAGTAEGFPVSAFDWNTFAYRVTYVNYNNVSGGTDRLYARDTDGAASYSWDLPGSENFVGTPRFAQESSNYYVYVVTTTGNVYKIQDNGTTLTTVAGWPYRDGASATATSPIILDSSNVYWAGNNGSGSRKVFSLTQSSMSLNGSASIAADMTAVPTTMTISGSSYIFGAVNGTVYKIPTTFAAATTNTQPTSTVSGRISSNGSLIYFIESTGKLWALNPSTLATDWSYQDTDGTRHAGGCTSANQCTSKNIYVQPISLYVHYGDQDGHVYVVSKSGSSGALMNGYPYRPGASTDTFVTAPLYREGVITIGSSGGKVFFIDRQNASNAPALIRTYNFGSAISTISYDRNSASSGEYMITTADGRLFYVSRIADPTSSNE